MANEVKVPLVRSAKIGGATIGGVDEAVHCDYQQVFQQSIGAGVANYRVDMPVTVANVKVSAIHTTGDTVTVYTNHPSTATNPGPDQTLVLAKNVPVLYAIGEAGAATPTLTTDVTSFYITNGGTSDCVVSIGVAGQQAPTGPA